MECTGKKARILVVDDDPLYGVLVIQALELAGFDAQLATSGLELLRPVAILALGAIIGFVAIAMFLPLVKLLNDLS